jgi:hypothetical protein
MCSLSAGYSAQDLAKVDECMKELAVTLTELHGRKLPRLKVHKNSHLMRK